MANYAHDEYSSKALTPMATTLADRPLVERLEMLAERLTSAHEKLDRLEGGGQPSAQGVAEPAGAFARTEMCLGSVGHLNERLDRLVARIGRL